MPAFDEIAQVLAGVDGTVSVWCGPLSGPAFFTHDELVPHYAASTMKLPLLVAAYRLADAGRLDLEQRVVVHNEFRSAADGSPFSLDRDYDNDDEPWARLAQQVPLSWLAERAIVRSSNLATNLLLDQVGTAAVAEVLRDCGATGTVVTRGIEDAAAERSGLSNRVTASGLAAVMCAVGRGTAASPAACETVESILARNEFRDGIPAGLPPGTYVADKTGWVDGVSHDAALVRPTGGEPVVLVICTRVNLPEDEASALVARLATAVWAGLPVAGVTS